MTRSRSRFSQALSDLLDSGNATRDFVAGRLLGYPQTIALYDGFGAPGRVYVHGRVLEDQSIAPATADQSRWKNMLAMISRADARPLAHAVVRVTVGSAYSGQQDLEIYRDVVREYSGRPHPDRRRRVAAR